MFVFSCPLCGEALQQSSKCFRCSNSHTFDRAAEGYVHLLPVQKKNSLSPGDDREMVRARREFLNSGAYQAFSDALNNIMTDILKPREKAVILDAGCGEGYYTDRLYTSSVENGFEWTVAGFDISKAAVKYAAKRNRGIQWAVASIFDIPVQSGKTDAVVNIFAPIVPAEFRRVLKAGGYLVIAVPGEKHLLGLKEILYDSVYENEHIDTMYEGFRFVERISVHEKLVLDDPQLIMALLTMTPYYWKTPASGIERLKRAESLQTPIEFDFLIYKAV